MSENGGERQRAWIQAALDQYEGQLIRFCGRLLGDRDRARDVVQESFLRLWQQDRAALGEQPGKWLFTVCRNLSIDIRRRDKRTTPLVAEVESPAPGAAQVAELKEESRNLLVALDTLSDEYQDVVRLRFQSGLSYKEIAEVTGLSVTNVGFILHTALKQIRARLEKIEAPRASHGGGK